MDNHIDDASLLLIINEFPSQEKEILYFIGIPINFTFDLIKYCFNEYDEIILKNTWEKIIKLPLVNISTLSHQYYIHERLKRVFMNWYRSNNGKLSFYGSKILDFYYFKLNNVKNQIQRRELTLNILYVSMLVNNDSINEWRHHYTVAEKKGELYYCEELLDILKKNILYSDKIVNWFIYYKKRFLLYKSNIQKNDNELQIIKNNNEEVQEEILCHVCNLNGILLYNSGRYKDALESLLLSIKLGKERFCIDTVFLNTGEVYRNLNNYTEAYSFVKKSIDKKLIIGDSYGLRLSYIIFGFICRDIAKYDDAIIYYEKALGLEVEGDKEDSADIDHAYIIPQTDIYNCIGEIYRLKGMFNKALKYHRIGLSVKKEQNDLIGVSWAWYEIGKVLYLKGDTTNSEAVLQRSYYTFNKYKHEVGMSYALTEISYVFQYRGEVSKAIEALRESVLIKIKYLNKCDLAFTFGHLGRLYQSQGFLSVAETIFIHCLSILDDGNNLNNAKAWVLNNLARNYLYKGDIQKSLYLFSDVLNLFRSMGNPRGEAYLLNNIGEAYTKFNNLTMALEYFTESYNMKRDMGDNHAICYTLREFAEVYIKMKNVDKAFEYLKKSMNLCKKYNFVMLEGDIQLSYGKLFLLLRNNSNAINRLNSAMNIYIKQSFFSRQEYVLNLIAKIFLNMNNVKKNNYAVKKNISISREKNKIEKSLGKTIKFIFKLWQKSVRKSLRS